MPKHLYKYYNYLQVIYSDGSFDISKDESSLIWNRFRNLIKDFRLSKYVGISSISVLDNAKRKILTLNFNCYECKEHKLD